MEHLQTSLFPTPPTGRTSRGTRTRGESTGSGVHYEPMVAVNGELPSDQWRYGFELKWNGVRALTYLHDGEMRIQSGKASDVLSQYPELLGLQEMAGARDLVVDGEIVATGGDGRPNLSRLHARAEMAAAGELWQAVEELPITYVIFDLLRLDGRDTTRLPYHHRRELLEGLELVGANWDTPPYLEEEGSALVHACRQRRLDGVLAKRIDSIYEPGKRSRAWLKIRIRPRQSFLVCGILPQHGSEDEPESVLLGVYDCTPAEALQRQSPQRLLYAGKMQLTGSADHEELRRRATGLRRETTPYHNMGACPTPLSDARFFEPILTCEAEFTEWSPLGIVQQASFKSFSSGTEPRLVVRET